MNRTALRLSWAVLLAGVISGSLLPDGSAALQVLSRLHLNDKLLHFGGYAALAFVPALHERRRVLRCIALGLVALGVGLEFGQLLSPGRSFELADMAADSVGVCSGVVAALPFRARTR